LLLKSSISIKGVHVVNGVVVTVGSSCFSFVISSVSIFSSIEVSETSSQVFDISSQSISCFAS
jgi:hypothetical protein